MKWLIIIPLLVVGGYYVFKAGVEILIRWRVWILFHRLESLKKENEKLQKVQNAFMELKEEYKNDDVQIILPQDWRHN